MKAIITVLVLLIALPVFAQSDEIDDAKLLDLLKQRDEIKKQMESANASGDYDKYKELEVTWNDLDTKIKNREQLIVDKKKEAKRLLDDASLLRRDKKYAQAKEKYEKLAGMGEFIGKDKIPGIKLMVAFCMERLKDYPGAKKVYGEVIALDPSDAKAYSGKARCMAKMGEYSDAVTFYQKAIEIDSKDYKNYFFIAESYEKIEMFNKAEENYALATITDPTYYKAWYNLGVLRFKMKKYETALEALSTAVKSDPSSSQEFYKAYTLSAQINNTIGNYTAAMDAAESAINLKANYGPAYLEKGIAQEKSEKYNLAIQSFEKCLNDRNCRDSAQWHINLIKEKYLQPQQ